MIFITAFVCFALALLFLGLSLSLPKRANEFFRLSLGFALVAFIMAALSNV